MFTGCGTALVTPFRQDQSLDEATLRKLVRRQIDAGMHFLPKPFSLKQLAGKVKEVMEAG